MCSEWDGWASILCKLKTRDESAAPEGPCLDEAFASSNQPHYSISYVLRVIEGQWASNPSEAGAQRPDTRMNIGITVGTS